MSMQYKVYKFIFFIYCIEMYRIIDTRLYISDEDM